MPSHTPGRRSEMEAALGPELLAAIHEQCLALDVRVSRWHENPVIARGWEMVAAKRLAARIRDAADVGEDRAFCDAATSLGLSPETLRSRWKRAS